VEDKIRDLASQLTSGDLEQRQAAAEQLCQLGHDAVPAIPALLGAVADADETVREWSIAALEGIGAPPPTLLDELVVRTAASGEQTPYWAVTLIGRLERGGAKASEVLVRVLQSHDVMAVRERAAWALGRLGADSPIVRRALEAVQQADNPRLARTAERSLRALAASE